MEKIAGIEVIPKVEQPSHGFAASLSCLIKHEEFAKDGNKNFVVTTLAESVGIPQAEAG